MDIDGDLLNLLQQELNTQGKDGKARSRGTGATKRASGGRRAKLNYEKQVQLLEQELSAKMTLARQLEGQKKALTENLQMLELHCKATGHYVQLMQEGDQQSKATAWLQKHTRAALNGGTSKGADQGHLGLVQGQAKQQPPEAGNEEDITEGMDWHQLLDGLTDVPGDQTPASASRLGAKLDVSEAGGRPQGAPQQRQQQPPKERCLSLNDVPVSDRPNETWLAAMRRATVDDFANVIREFVVIAGPLVLQAEAHGGLTPALNHLCLHVTKYMEFSNVLAIARSRTLYEAIEVDLETRAPRKPPHGFWANVAAVMRCTPEQMQQVQAAMRSYTTSLSAISDERMLLSRELSATIQASEAAARAVGQGEASTGEERRGKGSVQQYLPVGAAKVCRFCATACCVCTILARCSHLCK
ncbi:hypothetical protein DUNSADRAFT_8062 [Dunaliella salina]|uniref:Uncharacterized protein n=1 Tax=Dunaliella salina TaxID=3046 RepID=A0ABQ7GK66_DUNSA|nr:hypothetical protein DUNSADRAFT_8062 [Dunaliella salina]|eukprot:KAF5835005.1 hypothetical protein DUNSADRAFT_8062 [Dunaliella salina]